MQLGDELTLFVVELPGVIRWLCERNDRGEGSAHAGSCLRAPLIPSSFAGCCTDRNFTHQTMTTAQTGLPPSVLTQVIDVLRQHPEVERAVLFGSRAKGRARPNSDIDVALFGAVPTLVVERIAEELDELPTPYLFDLQAIEGQQNPVLLEHIQRVGVEIYSASQAPALP